ncbi:hypothetical protein PI124_g16668 [Phytophthora idaei]|nr:hypothetical protein PI125_g17481 [Phytophthora idaei]KAG3140103.1 hypothetical protein PI126_g16175 [Phytophthora idaei]KAG3238363.1 hypothetical protein PI124_g16668 [Phytophthora idaei]
MRRLQQAFVVLLLVTFASSLTTAERHQGVNKAHNLKESRKLTAGEEWFAGVESEERGISLTSQSKLISKLKAKISTMNFAGAKTEKLSNAQVQTVSREVAKEVNKNPKLWPTIKKGLEILYGTALFALIATGVYAMV